MSEWEDWLENGKGIRTLKNGVLTESDIGSVDQAIVSLFSTDAGNVPWHRPCDGDNRADGCAVRWRIKILLSAGVLKMEEGIISLSSPA